MQTLEHWQFQRVAKIENHADGHFHWNMSANLTSITLTFQSIHLFEPRLVLIRWKGKNVGFVSGKRLKPWSQVEPPWTSVFSSVKWKECCLPHNDAVKSNETASGKTLSQWLAHCRNLIFLSLSQIYIFFSLIGVWNEILNFYRTIAWGFTLQRASKDSF